MRYFQPTQLDSRPNILLQLVVYTRLDQVAVPDYPSGATEHWGIVTYREARLLYDSSIASLYDKQRGAAIVAHELSHHVGTSPVRQTAGGCHHGSQALSPCIILRGLLRGKTNRPCHRRHNRHFL